MKFGFIPLIGITISGLVVMGLYLMSTWQMEAAGQFHFGVAVFLTLLAALLPINLCIFWVDNLKEMHLQKITQGAGR